MGRKTLLAVLALVILFGGIGVISYMPSLQISAETSSQETIDKLTPVGSTSTSTESATTAGSGANLAISETDNEDEVTLTFNFGSVPPSWVEDGVSVYGLGGDENYKLDLTSSKVGDSETYSGQITVPSSLIADGTNIYVSNPSTETDAKSTFGLFSITSAKLANLKSAGIANFASTLSSVNTADLPAELTKAIEEAKSKKGNGTADTDLCAGESSSPIKYAICNLIDFVGDALQDWISTSNKAIFDTITNWGNARGDALQVWVSNGWAVTRSLVNIIAVIALIIVAFANILHINLNVYAVKRMLPLLIGSVIGANLSLFAIKAINVFSYEIAGSLTKSASDGIASMAGVLTKTFGSVLLAGFGFGNEKLGEILAGAGFLAMGTAPLAIVFLLVFVIATVLLIILGFLMYIQPGVVSILTIFAPVAIILGALPFGQGVFKKWLTYICNWIFMLPICLLMYTLIGTLSKTGYGTTEGLFALAGQIVILIFAVRVPFMMGGDIMKGWAGAGAFVGTQLSNRAFAGSMNMQVRRGNMNKKAGISEEELKGLNYNERRKLVGKKLKDAGFGFFARRGYNLSGLPAETVAAIHPRAIVSGFQAVEAGREAQIKGLMPSFSKGFRGVPGNKYAILESEMSSWEQKVATATDSKLVEELRKIQKDTGYTDEEMRKIAEEKATNSKGGYFGKAFAGGTTSSRMDPEQLAHFFTVDEELKKRGREEAMGEVASPLSVERNIRDNALRDATLRTLGMSYLYAEDITDPGEKDKLLKLLERDIKEQYGTENFEKMWSRVQKVSDQIKKRREYYERDWGAGGVAQGNQQNVPGQVPSGAEYGGSNPREDDLIRSTMNGLAQPAGQVVPVVLDNPAQLKVVDATMQLALERATKEVMNALDKANADPALKQQIAGVLENVRIAPEDVGRLIDDQGRLLAAGGKTVALGKPTETLMKRFVLTASNSDISTTSAEDYFERNLSGLMPYFEEVSKAVADGGLKTSELKGIESDITQKLSVIRGGGTLSPEALSELRDNVAKVSPGVSITPQTSVEDLMRTGTTVTTALERMRDPQVTRVLEQKGSPQQVQEVIVKQAAQGLIRQTSVDRIGSIASQPQKPVTVKVQEVARQVGSFASNSSSAQQWGGLSPVAKQQVATEVARQVVGIKGVDEATVAKAVAAKLATVRTTGGASASQATQPALNVPGATRPIAPTPAPTASAQPSTAPQPTTPAPSTALPPPPTPTPPAPPPPSPQTQQPPPAPPVR